MTTYGTIPTTSNPNPNQSTNLELIHQAQAQIRSTLNSKRPWRQFLSIHSLSFPISFNDSHLRARANLSHFRSNYLIIILLTLFISLLWHPISLIVFIAMMSTWLFLYFLRDAPLVLLGRVVDDRIVLLLLGFLTLLFLLMTDVTVNIVVALVVGVGVVVAHAVMRRVDDLPLQGGFDDEVGSRFVYRTTGGLGERLPLKDAASSLY